MLTQRSPLPSCAAALVAIWLLRVPIAAQVIAYDDLGTATSPASVAGASLSEVTLAPLQSRVAKAELKQSAGAAHKARHASSVPLTGGSGTSFEPGFVFEMAARLSPRVDVPPTSSGHEPYAPRAPPQRREF
jgi:hypothetical protein